MNKINTIAASFILLSSFFLGRAYAGNNSAEIDMTGTVISSSCNINTDDKNQVVHIGDFSSNLFKSVGDTSDTEEFVIRLSDCNADTSGAKVSFSGTPDDDNNQLVALSDTSSSGGMASGIGIEVLDEYRKTIPINTTSDEYILSETNGVLIFYLRYKATKIPVTPGNASSIMYFDIAYQ
ncbi:TPA: fimbrial protein [Citrobacter freundii]